MTTTAALEAQLSATHFAQSVTSLPMELFDKIFPLPAVVALSQTCTHLRKALGEADGPQWERQARVNGFTRSLRHQNRSWRALCAALVRHGEKCAVCRIYYDDNLELAAQNGYALPAVDPYERRGSVFDMHDSKYAYDWHMNPHRRHGVRFWARTTKDEESDAWENPVRSEMRAHLVMRSLNPFCEPKKTYSASVTFSTIFTYGDDMYIERTKLVNESGLSLWDIVTIDNSATSDGEPTSHVRSGARLTALQILSNEIILHWAIYDNRPKITVWR